MKADVINVNPFNGGSGGGGGTSDYPDLTNKPKINGVTLVGSMTPEQLGLEPASKACFGRYWNESMSQSKATGYFGNLDFGKNLVANLGLGRYLVTDDRRYTKLNPQNSNQDIAGNAVALDGTQGQCMWCWNEFYYGAWKETISGVVYTFEVVSLLPTYQNHKLTRIPRGGLSWLNAGVWDASGGKLCSLISNDANYRGGGGSALNPATYTQLDADLPQCSFLGMPRTEKSLNAFSAAARLRGTGWEADWFVARAVLEILMRIYFGNRNSQAAINANADSDGLPQGGLGAGVTEWSSGSWNSYNGYHPLIPNVFSIKDDEDNNIGDFTGQKIYAIKDKDGQTVYSAKVPFFAGLMNPFGHIWQFVNGLIVDIEVEGASKVYVTPSMYAAYDSTTVADKIFAGNMARSGGWIKELIYDKLAMMPSKVGGSSSTYHGDELYTDPATYHGLKVRLAGGRAYYGALAGTSDSNTYYSATGTDAYISAPLCVFNDDPQIE